MTTSYQDRIEELTPLAYWRLAETSGTLAADAASDLAGRYEGGVALGAAGLPDDGTAARFDGHNDRVVIDHDERLRLGEGTISLWFQAERLSGQQGLFDQGCQRLRRGRPPRALP